MPPRVQLVSAATPLGLVATTAGLAGEVAPPPLATVKVTLTPATALPLTSVTTTLGGAVTLVPAVADCVVTEFAAMVVAAPACTVTVPEVTGVRPPALKVMVRSPVAPVIFMALKVAAPLAFVLADPPASVPAPLASAAVTAVPFCEIGFPAASWIWTTGAGEKTTSLVTGLGGGVVRASLAAAPA